MEVLAFTLHGVPVWMPREWYNESNGALMPTPNHAQETRGMGVSYAHMINGRIVRYGETIGSKADMIPVIEA